MSSIYDEENFLEDALNLFQTHLPTFINNINNRKNDSITLASIANELYKFNSLDSSVWNYRGFFILYGFGENVPTELQEDNFLEPVTISFEVATFDNGEQDRRETVNRLIRYRRALKECILKNFDSFRGFTKPKVVSLEPAAFVFPNSNDTVLAAGIEIRAILSAV